MFVTTKSFEKWLFYFYYKPRYTKHSHNASH